MRWVPWGPSTQQGLARLQAATETSEAQNNTAGALLTVCIEGAHRGLARGGHAYTVVVGLQDAVGPSLQGVADIYHDGAGNVRARVPALHLQELSKSRSCLKAKIPMAPGKAEPVVWGRAAAVHGRQRSCSASGTAVQAGRRQWISNLYKVHWHRQP
jgi:hypothetical protein